jgi:hypothetical protein
VRREPGFLRDFRGRADAWKAELAELETHWYGDDRFALALEVRAWRFSGPPRKWASIAQLAHRSWVGEAEVEALFDDVLKEEMQRVMTVEFDGQRGVWEDGFAELRQRVTGEDFAIASAMVCQSLHRTSASVDQLAKETGIRARRCTGGRTSWRSWFSNCFPRSLLGLRRGGRLAEGEGK